MLSKLSLIALAGALATVSAQGPNKPALQPGLDYGRLESDLRNNLHPTHSNWNYWGAGWIPKACKEIAQGKNLNPFDFTIFNVHYDDCAEPWIMCRHKDSAASEIDMIDMFGRMPVHMRDYVRQFIATPSLGGNIAGLYWYPGDVLVTGRPDMWLLAHELSHALDFQALRQYSSPFSDHSIWRDNVNQDSAVPTDYSHNNYVENFAEAGMVGLYDKVVPGGFGTMNSNWNAIYHQYATYQGYLGDTIVPGGYCRNRVGNSEPVTMSNGAKFQSGLGEKPDVSFKSNVTVIEINPELIGVSYAIHDHQ